MMKHAGLLRLFAVICMTILIISSAAASAQVPQKINYQGYLTDAAGNPVDGSLSMTFAIYEAATGGSALWSETRTVTVDNGRYSVNLGAVNPLNLTEAKPYYLGVQVGTDPEMTPRKELTSAMYSLFVDGITVKDGNVGIGTTNPHEVTKLHINGGSIFVDHNEDNPSVRVRYNDENYGSILWHKDQNVFKIYTREQNQLYEDTLVLQRGNVGIGTPNPDQSAKLHVNGGSIFVDHSGDNPSVRVRYNEENYGSILWHKDQKAFKIYTREQDQLYENTLALKGGRVGIGIIPGEGSFDWRFYDYKLAVNGSIRTRGIKVDNNAWSDFVFHDSYELMPLQEVEQYIKMHKHLPDIPSTQEVQENGVDLGEMQSKLLQKVEELTLHLIELEKENARLQERVSTLESLLE